MGNRASGLRFVGTIVEPMPLGLGGRSRTNAFRSGGTE